MNAAANELQLIDELALRYVVAVDGKDMPGWLATFDEQGQYRCVTAESESAGWTIALMLDDCRGRLEDRVRFVDKIWAGTFQDYQTRHFVQRLDCRRAEDGLFHVRSQMQVLFTRSDTGSTQPLAAGLYHDIVSVVDGQARFRSRKVVLDAPLLPHYIVYPL